MKEKMGMNFKDSVARIWVVNGKLLEKPDLHFLPASPLLFSDHILKCHEDIMTLFGKRSFYSYLQTLKCFSFFFFFLDGPKSKFASVGS